MRIVALLALALAACGPAPQPPSPAAAPAGWREFEGSWNAAGSRRTLSLGGRAHGSLIDLRGLDAPAAARGARAPASAPR